MERKGQATMTKVKEWLRPELRIWFNKETEMVQILNGYGQVYQKMRRARPSQLLNKD